MGGGRRGGVQHFTINKGPSSDQSHVAIFSELHCDLQLKSLGNPVVNVMQKEMMTIRERPGVEVGRYQLEPLLTRVWIAQLPTTA